MVPLPEASTPIRTGAGSASGVGPGATGARYQRPGGRVQAGRAADRPRGTGATVARRAACARPGADEVPG